MSCPKMNPSRIFTPEGQCSWGGSCMAIFNVESPGDYQLTGLTVPGVDVLGWKRGFAPERPWLFDDFDEICFREVAEVDYERDMALFRSGRYEFEVEESTFDMVEHNALLRETEDEVKIIRAKQLQAQEGMDRKEKELLERWNEDKVKDAVPQDSI